MSKHGSEGRFARWVRRLALPIAIIWLALAASVVCLLFGLFLPAREPKQDR